MPVVMLLRALANDDWKPVQAAIENVEVGGLWHEAVL